MKRTKVEISAGAALAAAFICFFGNMFTISAIMLPVLIHELAHIVTLCALGMNIRSFSFQLKGICIRYSGTSGALGDILAAVAGPAAGLIYALTASELGVQYSSQWLCLSSGISLLLSVFNLLPALPLDGGRIFMNIACAFLGERKGMSLITIVGTVIGAILLAFGFAFMRQGQGMALVLAAAWILLCQIESAGIVKRQEVL